MTIQEAQDKKYVGIKLAGLPYWIWFELDKTKEECGSFTGTAGWGRDNSYVERLKVDACAIEGRVYGDKHG